MFMQSLEYHGTAQTGGGVMIHAFSYGSNRWDMIGFFMYEDSWAIYNGDDFLQLLDVYFGENEYPEDVEPVLAGDNAYLGDYIMVAPFDCAEGGMFLVSYDGCKVSVFGSAKSFKIDPHHGNRPDYPVEI